MGSEISSNPSTMSMFGDLLGQGASSLGSSLMDNKDLLFSGAKTYLDYDANKKNRKAEADRFNKMFDFDREQVNRTNRLEDERQASLDSVYGNQASYI